MNDDLAAGRQVLDVRVSKNLRQSDVAARAGISREMVSRLERGLADGMTISVLRAISRALEMPPIVTVGWRTPEIDRLRDRVHAAIVEFVVRLLDAGGCEVAPESSFNRYGERGSADVLAWHGRRRALLIVETKSRIWDVQDTLSALDRKRRVLPAEVERRYGWTPAVVGAILVLPDLSTHRHVVARYSATFRAAFPHGQIQSRHWLEEPTGDLRGILFLPISHLGDIGRRSTRKRACPVRTKHSRTAGPRSSGPSAAKETPAPGADSSPSAAAV